MVLSLLIARGWRVTSSNLEPQEAMLIGASAALYVFVYALVYCIDMITRDPADDVYPLMTGGARLRAWARAASQNTRAEEQACPGRSLAPQRLAARTARSAEEEEEADGQCKGEPEQGRERMAAGCRAPPLPAFVPRQRSSRGRAPLPRRPLGSQSGICSASVLVPRPRLAAVSSSRR